MAQRLEWFDVTVPANTAIASAIETGLQFNAGQIERIELTIPDGHSGLTGIRFNSAHQQVIPLTAGSWIIGNDTERSWPFTGLPDNGNWSVTCYNTDVYAHTFHFLFLVNELTGASVAPVQLIPAAGLGSGVPTPPTAGLPGAAAFLAPSGV